eukprot:m.38384 g.38384  ORF g.38384 m.38384 type:complete len:205 (-) comp7823_c0_seq1:882-1496(-)
MTANLNDSLVSTLDVDENVLFTNCRIFRDGKILKDDLWVKGGKIIDGQLWFYANQEKATRVVDCKGHILAPGFIDIQLNGGFGVDFSIPEKDLDTAIKVKSFLSAPSPQVHSNKLHFRPLQKECSHTELLPFARQLSPLGRTPTAPLYHSTHHVKVAVTAQPCSGCIWRVPLLTQQRMVAILSRRLKHLTLALLSNLRKMLKNA